jgi:4a-hydroxytetrahydrobiopterin dehydratase
MTDQQLTAALTQLPLWRIVQRDSQSVLHRTIRFADFPIAISFMVAAACDIEKLNHHPEWRNVYNRVEIDLITHDDNAITEKDLQLAALLDQRALQFGALVQ